MYMQNKTEIKCYHNIIMRKFLIITRYLLISINIVFHNNDKLSHSNVLLYHNYDKQYHELV